MAKKKKKNKKSSFKKKFLLFLLLVCILAGGLYLGFYTGSKDNNTKQELTEDEKENINYKKNTIRETLTWIDEQLSSKDGLNKYKSRLIDIKNMNIDEDYNKMYKEVLYLKDDINDYLAEIETEKEKAEEIDASTNKNNSNNSTDQNTNDNNSNENVDNNASINLNENNFSKERALQYLVNSNNEYKNYSITENNGTYYFTENNNKIFAIVLWNIETSPITNLQYYAYNIKELNPETGEILDSIEFGLIYEDGSVTVE